MVNLVWKVDGSVLDFQTACTHNFIPTSNKTYLLHCSPKSHDQYEIKKWQVPYERLIAMRSVKMPQTNSL